jgi:hypothetical protein
VLLVLAGEKANVASTRMVTNMTMKHLTPAVVAGLEAAARGGLPAAPAPVAPPSAPAPAVSTPPAAAPAVTAASPVAAAAVAGDAAKPVRMYRGRAY